MWLAFLFKTIFFIPAGPDQTDRLIGQHSHHQQCHQQPAVPHPGRTSALQHHCQGNVGIRVYSTASVLSPPWSFEWRFISRPGLRNTHWIYLRWTCIHRFIWLWGRVSWRQWGVGIMFLGLPFSQGPPAQASFHITSPPLASCWTHPCYDQLHLFARHPDQQLSLYTCASKKPFTPWDKTRRARQRAPVGH